jgi:hypothetical protein
MDGPTFHVIIGSDFAVNVTAEAKRYILVKASDLYIVVFKAG